MTINAQGGPRFSQPTEIADDTRNIGGMTSIKSGNLFFTDDGHEAGQSCPNDQIDEIPDGTTGISNEGFYTTCQPSTGFVTSFPGISGIYQVALSPFGGSPADSALYVANFNLNGDRSQTGQTWQGGTGDIIAITESIPEAGSTLLLVGIDVVYSRGPHSTRTFR